MSLADGEDYWQATCTGAFVDRNDVLTAAHCLWDDAAAGPYDLIDIRVCTRGNYGTYADCWRASDVDIGPDYAGGKVMANDYAIMNISVGTDYQDYMVLSQHSNSALTNREIRHYGNPGWRDADAGTCTNNSVSEASTVDFHPDIEMLYMMFDEGDSVVATTEVLGAKIDAGGGQSGGPMYVWDLGVPVHVAPLKGFNPFGAYTGGARTSNFRTWALGKIQGN